MPVGLSGSETGLNYQLQLNGSNIGSAIPGNAGNAISFGNQTSAGTYTVVASDGTPMSGSVTININSPPATPTPGNNGPVCAGSTLNLTTPAVAGATYSWTGPNGFTSNVQNPSIVNVSTAAAGTYTVTVTDGNGCSSSATTSVTITALPTASISYSGSPFCTSDATAHAVTLNGTNA